MSSIKCPNCGLVNFAEATSCKRCKQAIEAPSYPYWNESGAVKPEEPDWSKLQAVPDAPGEDVDFEEYGDGSHTVGNRIFAIYLLLHMVGTLFALNYVTSVTTGKAAEEAWKAFVDPKSQFYLASFEASYYLVLLGVIVLLPGALILLLTLYRKAKAFLTLVVMYLIAEFIHNAVSIWIMFSLAKEIREKNLPQFNAMADQADWIPWLGMMGILLTFIWFRYFTTSKRARLVFE